jgi:hypothetical protein
MDRLALLKLLAYATGGHGKISAAAVKYLEDKAAEWNLPARGETTMMGYVHEIAGGQAFTLPKSDLAKEEVLLELIRAISHEGTPTYGQTNFCMTIAEQMGISDTKMQAMMVKALMK